LVSCDNIGCYQKKIKVYGYIPEKVFGVFYSNNIKRLRCSEKCSVGVRWVFGGCSERMESRF